MRDVCRENEVSEATYYQWKSKYGGMEASDIRRLRELERGANILKRTKRRATERLLAFLNGFPLMFGEEFV